MNSVEEIKIKTRKRTLAAKRWGKGEPVLAIHGWLDNAASFDFIAPYLEGIELIALDLPGHGWSEHKSTDAHYYLWEYVGDIIDTLDALGWETASLLGHSLGASIASLTAASFPQRINKIVLLDGLGPWVISESELPQHLAHSLTMDHKLSKSKSVYSSIDEAVAVRLKGGLPLSEKAARVIVERALQKTEAGFMWRTDPRLKQPSLFRMSEIQALAFLEKIECPVCLLLDEQLFFEQGSYSTHRQSVIKHLIVNYFNGGHHLHMDEDVQKITAVLIEFLIGSK